MGTRLRILPVVAGAALLAVNTPMAPAHAAPAAECSYSVTQYGYTGYFKCGTSIIHVDWDVDGSMDESFGIAPNRTIWHAWPASGAWRQMPNNGRADRMHKVYWNGRGQRQVEVVVNTSGGTDVWYSYYNGAWRGWYYYPGS